MSTAVLRLSGAQTIGVYVEEAKAQFLQLLRLPTYSLPTLIFPAVFYIIFGLLYASSFSGMDSDLPKHVVATLGAFGVIGASLFCFGVSISIERSQGWLELKRASPMPLSAYFVAKVLASCAFCLLIILELITLATVFGKVRFTLVEIVSLTTVLVLGSVPFCTMGLAVAAFIDAEGAVPVINTLYLPMGFCSGLWIPIASLPHVIQSVAPFIPAYHLGRLALGSIGVADASSVWLHVGVLAGWTVLFLALTRVGFKRDFS